MSTARVNPVKIREEQRHCWFRGQPIPAEDLLARYPDLDADPEAALDVIFNEYLLRERLGEVPTTEEFAARFPQFALVLRDQIDLHRAVMLATTTETQATIHDSPSKRTVRAPLHPWPQVPGYELIAEIGRGGMGVVYKARHLALQRMVALKFVRPNMVDDEPHLFRMQQEAELAARLRHPNIVQIYEVGLHEGYPFLTLEYIDGPSLEAFLQGQPQPPRQAAELLERLAQAIQVAHENDVVHRDLKPANILLGSTGDSLSERVPKITDFGLARRLSNEISVTQTGAIIGTPAYMPPEQASGSGLVGPATDVYALGAILYELLTGQPPFHGQTPFQVLQDVLHQDVPAPSRIVPRLPQDLCTICMKCLQKSPAERYRSAQELAAELGRFREGRPILARPVSYLEHWWRWSRRSPVLAGSLGAIACLLFLVFAGTTAGLFYLNAALKRTKQAEGNLGIQLEAMERKDRETQERLFDTLVAQANANRLSRQPGQRFQTLELLNQAKGVAQRFVASTTRTRALTNATTAALALPDVVPEWTPAVAGTFYADFSADGQLLARFNSTGEVTLHRSDTDKVIAHSRIEGPPWGIVLHPTGQYLAAITGTEQRLHQAVIWRVTPEGLREVVREPDALRVRFHQQRSLVALGRKDLLVLDLETGTRRTIATKAQRELRFDLHPHLPCVAVTGPDENTVQILDLTTGEEKFTLHLNEECTWLSWSPDGAYLAVSHQLNVDIRDAVSPAYPLLRTIPVVVGGGTRAIFDYHSRRLLVHGWNTSWEIYDAHTGGLQVRFAKGILGNDCLRLVGSDRVGPLSDGKQTGLLRLDDHCVLQTLLRPRQEKHPAYIFPTLLVNGQILATGGGGIGLWNLNNGAHLHTIPGTTGIVRAKPHHDELFVHMDQLVHRYRVRQPRPDTITVGRPEHVALPDQHADIRFSADGRVRLTAHRQDGVWLADETSAAGTTQLLHDDNVWGCAVSPDGKWAALKAVSVGGFCKVTIWEVTTRKIVHTLPELPSTSLVDFSPDGRFLVVWGPTGRLYNVGNWKESRSLGRGHGIISPDGKWLARDDGSGTIHLENVEDGQEWGLLLAQDTSTHAELLITADGRKLIAPRNGSDAGIEVWNLSLLREQLHARGLGTDWPTLPPSQRSANGPMRLQHAE